MSASKCSLAPPAADPVEVYISSVLFPKTWSEFVSCIKRYTSDCLTPDQVSSSSQSSPPHLLTVSKFLFHLIVPPATDCGTDL